MLYLEAMGQGRLSGIAQTRGVRAGCMEYPQVGAWPMEAVEYPGAGTGFAGAVLPQSRATVSCGQVGIIFIEPPCT